MRSFAHRHPIRTFLAFAYGASAAIFAIPLLSNAGIGVIDLDLPGAAPFVLLSAFALVGAAFLATALGEGRDGVRKLRGRVFRFRVSTRWYLVAFLALPGAALAAAVVVSGVAPLVALLSNPVMVLGVVIGAIVAFALVNWWEEAAWTGFALHRLQRRIGPVKASVATTWMQALVHVPLVFVAGGVTDGRVAPDQVPFYLVALFVLPIPVRVTLTWLYNASGRSVPIAGLYHAGLGVATGAAWLPVLVPGIYPLVAYAGFAALAVVVLVATRGRLGLEPGAGAAGARRVTEATPVAA
jgi:membrane protease YdiL (CAAX protease family)